jgi:hypothetical protein
VRGTRREATRRACEERDAREAMREWKVKEENDSGEGQRLYASAEESFHFFKRPKPLSFPSRSVPARLALRALTVVPHLCPQSPLVDSTSPSCVHYSPSTSTRATNKDIKLTYHPGHYLGKMRQQTFPLIGFLVSDVQ